MAYEAEMITYSQKIFYYLLCHGALSDLDAGVNDLYRAYVEHEEVMNLVKNQAEIADCTEVVRICDNLVAVLLLGEILSACIECSHHELVGIHITLFFVDHDLALAVEHEGNASLCAYVSAALCEGASYVCCGTVLVVSQCVNDDRNTARTVSLIC